MHEKLQSLLIVNQHDGANGHGSIVRAVSFGMDHVELGKGGDGECVSACAGC